MTEFVESVRVTAHIIVCTKILLNKANKGAWKLNIYFLLKHQVNDFINIVYVYIFLLFF